MCGEQKDPNAPKKAMSGFMFFSQVNRGKVKEEDPSLGIGGIAKILGERCTPLPAALPALTVIGPDEWGVWTP
eukprot:3357208-Pyramimonas_sp.AAC.2